MQLKVDKMNKYLDKLTKDDFKNIIKKFVVDDISNYKIKVKLVDENLFDTYIEITGCVKDYYENFKARPLNQIRAFKMELKNFSAKLTTITIKKQVKNITKSFVLEMCKKFGEEYLSDYIAKYQLHEHPNNDTPKSSYPYETDKELADLLNQITQINKKKKEYSNMFR